MEYAETISGFCAHYQSVLPESFLHSPVLVFAGPDIFLLHIGGGFGEIDLLP